MKLKDRIIQEGEMCLKCTKGVLVTKLGRYGQFLACDRYPKRSYTHNQEVNLQNIASALLKEKSTKRKPRRGKKK